ncbi:transcriptional adapter 1 [Harpegnathos saltator]|uniref:Transcriptional adapter 1-like protein n=1 Tax=Harpegnathos saltator TaxID=610380 RepID=E2BA55_HARSA|nr:transcriptional adapter 1 [Harpegnathos saltator]EFN87464.1 Transcriptional adapter 1-like protein [Harpegnathos saltator]
MTTSKELNLARKSLVASLGDNAKVYFEKMKLWFQMKTTKEEFDYEARNIMTEDQVRLHNEFLLCLFNKVRGLAAAAPTYKIDRDKNLKERRLRLKRKYKTDKSNFEPADMYVEVLSQTSSPVRDEPIGANRSSAQELVLPDRTFVLARLMLAAWENNMDGAEDNTAHIVIAATQIFLKNILTAIFTRRKGYATRDGSFIYNIGEPVPSSWKKNSMYLHPLHCGPTEVLEPHGHVPALKPTIEEAEQATAFAHACSTQIPSPPLKPVSTADLRHTLKIYKNLVSNHTIYATNMERLYTYATHPSWEDLEVKKMLCQPST